MYFDVLIKPEHSIFYMTAYALGEASQNNAYIIFDPLKPHFYIVKLGFTEVHIIFLFLLKNIDCVLLRTASPSSNMKISEFFLSENFQFLEVKFPIYLNSRVYVMTQINLRIRKV